ncbi:DNA topoisomerase [Halococcus agarilyticus]|uniref:DNA topoisomerase n=1 Tax=Halococcus agarilyticus TaxID=1232219 RepID=UPI0006779BF4|nr:DNA topoisomerase [Halococcus agarilyticus]
MELIITEKETAARNIAEILSGESADVERRNGVNVYKWGGRRCVGLSGHVVENDFPPEYANWRDVEPVELIDAEVVVEPHESRENIVRTLRLLARDADGVIIATDYDREGELIGKEAHDIVRDVTDAPIRRARFSSFAEPEVREAFDDLDDLDFDLAAAGEARQEIDLVWGAALTRFLSLSAKQMGSDFISVGRVQSPTLKLIVDREREIEAFDPDDYWELFCDLEKDDERFEAQYFYDDDGSEAERIWDEDVAETVYDDLRGASTATVEEVRRRTRTDDPPAPFNTTQYIRAASSLGYSAQRAMSLAEELYTAGYITYPRTDNTVYPDDLDVEELLGEFTDHPEFGDDADALLEGEPTPTEGDEETTDHPPIHPTGELPSTTELGDDERTVYELVVRRFFATVADPAEWEHLRVTAVAGDHQLKANGKRLLEPGYHAVYPYVDSTENHVPDVEEGDELPVSDVRSEAKETQPPRRRGQSRLIETMESKEIGTKCLTGDTPILTERDGGIVRVPIREAFENGRVALSDGDTDIAINETGPKTLSFDESDGRVAERTQTLVSERPLRTDEQVHDVTTTAGSFSATGEHPVYKRTDEGIELARVAELAPGDELLSARRSVGGNIGAVGTIATWEEFAASCDISTKLYGTACNATLREHRTATNETQVELAERLGTDRTHISAYENDRRDVPAWILGKLGIRPPKLHGLNYDCAFDNPFPIEWCPAVARVFANLLGDGSVHINEAENVVDIRYHNTDRRLIERFSDDIESIFGFRPTISEQDGHEAHHRSKYQVRIPGAVGRVLVYVLDTVTENGCPRVPEPLQPAFIGALFDDEGHISTDAKAFVSNIDHDLLRGVAEMLSQHDIDSALAENQHKLYIRGRKRLEPFLDTVPIAADEKFYRGLQALKRYDVTEHNARLLRAMAERPRTSEELAAVVGLSRGRVNALLREFRAAGFVQRHIEGSNRSHDGNRTIRYSTNEFSDSIYATVLGSPATATVASVEERDYDGPVYDLTIDEEAPNFAVEGGVIVHNSTRHNTIEKLYDRGYIENDPPQPTTLAKAVVDASERFAEQVVSEAMTERLEADMDAIASGEITLDEVTDESREMLATVFEELHDSREAIGDYLRNSLKVDKTLGPCPDCGAALLVRRSRHGSYFVGCDGYPDCEFTLPLPSSGKPVIQEETCDEHELRAVKMLDGRNTFVHGCPICAAEDADETEDRVIGACPECGGEKDNDEEGGELAIKSLRTGSRLAGCTRYPDCEYSLPLPRRGEIEVTDEYCEEHALPELVVHSGDDPWELGCPVCNYREYQARQAATDLEDLDGLGAKTAEKLAAVGIDSLDDLREGEADAVAAEVQGVSADNVRKWQAKAD